MLVAHDPPSAARHIHAPLFGVERREQAHMPAGKLEILLCERIKLGQAGGGDQIILRGGVGAKAGATPALAGSHALAGQERQRALLGIRPVDREIDGRLAEGLALQQQRDQQAGGGEDREEQRQQARSSRAWRGGIVNHGCASDRIA